MQPVPPAPHALTPEFLERILSLLEDLQNGGQGKTKKMGKIHPEAPRKCPSCGGKWIVKETGILCPKCLTVPRRFYIYVYWDKRPLRIYSDENGNPLSSFELAKKLLERIRFEISSHTFDPSKYVRSEQNEFRLENYFSRYLEYCSLRLKPGTLKEKNRIFRQYILPHLGTMDIREIRGSHVFSLYTKIMKKKELSEKSVKNILTELKALLNYARKVGDLRELPPFPEINPPAPIIRWIDEDIQQKVLENIPKEHLPAFIFIITYGCRPGEARALMWDCIDFKNETILIRRTFSKNTLVEIPKERDWKVLPLLPHIRAILENLAENAESSFVFTSPLGGPYGERTLSKIWKRACQKIGVDISLYAGTRHSFVMIRLKHGFTYEQIGPCLGHKSPETTKRYGRLQAQELIPVFESAGPFSNGKNADHRSQNFLHRNITATHDLNFSRDFSRNLCETWSGRQDLNLRPLTPEASALPG